MPAPVGGGVPPLPLCILLWSDLWLERLALESLDLKPLSEVVTERGACQSCFPLPLFLGQLFHGMKYEVGK